MPPRNHSQQQASPPCLRTASLIKVIKAQLTIAAMVLVAFPLCHAAQSVTLAWDPNPEPDIAKYKVYYGKERGNPDRSFEAGNVTRTTVVNLDDATTYFFAVTAINLNNLESGPSNEASYTTPAQEERYWLTVNFGTGSGPYRYGDVVLVSAEPPRPGQKFAGWDGDRDILANFMSMETTARIVRMENLTITATYSDLPRYTLTVANGTGSGAYLADEEVEVTANAAPAGQQFAGWTGGNIAFADATSPTTTLTMPSYEVTVTATYKVSDRIRYYPRSGHRDRMVGGVFEGTNDPANGYVELYKINANPPQAWTAVNVNLRGYKYLRYRGPDGSYGNVAEIEFYRNGAKVVGTGYGTAGSWRNRGATFQRALDNRTDTYFDGPTANGNYVGIFTQ